MLMADNKAGIQPTGNVQPPDETLVRVMNTAKCEKKLEVFHIYPCIPFGKTVFSLLSTK